MPYLVLFGWILIFSGILGEGIGGLIVGSTFMVFGVVAMFFYSVILGVVLLIRWIIIRRRV